MIALFCSIFIILTILTRIEGFMGWTSYHTITGKPFSDSKVRHQVDFLVRRSMPPCKITQKTVYPVQNPDPNEDMKVELIKLCDAYTKKLDEQWAEDDSAVGDAIKAIPKQRGLLGASSFTDERLQQSNITIAILEIINKLAKCNPTSKPTSGWESSAIVGMKDEDIMHIAPLDGTWKLRFTTAGDATFRPGKRGKARTEQIANATSGYFLNCIKFPDNPGKTMGFTVYVKGIVKSHNEMELNFKKVVIHRRSRFPRIFGSFTIPLPNILSLFNIFRSMKNQLKSPYFKVLYLDDDLRIHVTGENNYFVQTRLYDVWDPSHPSGWKKIALL